MEKNGTFIFKNGKEHNVPNGKERSAQPWQDITFSFTVTNNQTLSQFDLSYLNSCDLVIFLGFLRIKNMYGVKYAPDLAYKYLKIIRFGNLLFCSFALCSFAQKRSLKKSEVSKALLDSLNKFVFFICF